VKEYLRQLIGQGANDLLQRNLVREYLQARILESLQDNGVFLRWAFLGGTALRFLYSIPRFSEDLDFSLITPGEEAGFRTALAGVKRTLTTEGYRIDIKLSDHKTVASAFIRFPSLPYELGLSPHASQTLSIKVEVDKNPPDGAVLVNTVVRRHITLQLCHHDRASLLAGKLHAVMCRPWVKGRDLYDLAWYLAERSWPEPNLILLNAALKQTGWTGPVMTPKSWSKEVRKHLADIDWDKARDDVNPFLERERDLALVSMETISHLLRGDNKPLEDKDR
jgi:predicted nucleotidyltransferase component of viral defense system